MFDIFYRWLQDLAEKKDDGLFLNKLFTQTEEKRSNAGHLSDYNAFLENEDISNELQPNVGSILLTNEAPMSPKGKAETLNKEVRELSNIISDIVSQRKSEEIPDYVALDELVNLPARTRDSYISDRLLEILKRRNYT